MALRPTSAEGRECAEGFPPYTLAANPPTCAFPRRAQPPWVTQTLSLVAATVICVDMRTIAYHVTYQRLSACNSPIRSCAESEYDIGKLPENPSTLQLTTQFAVAVTV